MLLFKMHFLSRTLDLRLPSPGYDSAMLPPTIAIYALCGKIARLQLFAQEGQTIALASVYAASQLRCEVIATFKAYDTEGRLLARLEAVFRDTYPRSIIFGAAFRDTSTITCLLKSSVNFL